MHITSMSDGFIASLGAYSYWTCTLSRAWLCRLNARIKLISDKCIWAQNKNSYFAQPLQESAHRKSSGLREESLDKFGDRIFYLGSWADRLCNILFTFFSFRMGLFCFLSMKLYLATKSMGILTLSQRKSSFKSLYFKRLSYRPVQLKHSFY